jgi:hypothetical protein
MADSSAAGYQMRKHYMTYLLALECEATGQNENDLRDFSEKQKKAKRRTSKQDKDGLTGAQATADSPSTPAAMHQPPEQQPSQGEHICYFEGVQIASVARSVRGGHVGTAVGRRCRARQAGI